MSYSKTSGNSASRILIASLVGTTIEFFDFYIYATAAVLVFPKLFFPGSEPTNSTLESQATFALAFFARPIDAALFGHFGGRIGREATQGTALWTMGASPCDMGLLPAEQSMCHAATILLVCFFFGLELGWGWVWGRVPSGRVTGCGADVMRRTAGTRVGGSFTTFMLELGVDPEL